MKGNRGSNRLARLIAQRIADQTSRPSVIELGKINSDMSLKLDRFPHPIPAGDYLVCRSLTLPNPMTITNTVSDHSHSVSLPGELAPLSPDDRVLVVWAHDVEPVIIDVVV